MAEVLAHAADCMGIKKIIARVERQLFDTDQRTIAQPPTAIMSTDFIQPGIFNHPRPKKSVLPPPNKRRRIDHKIEEISFDDSKREDYLTGFHKRKVQRIKRAQEENEKKLREERRQMRKQVIDARNTAPEGVPNMCNLVA